ncbi:glycosyltransferase [Caldicellulosiruptoraceae bacterium PP1]
MNDIICFSTTAWEPIPTRKQQVMKRMPDNFRIFYIEPPITLIGPLKDPLLKPYYKKYKSNPFKVKDNLYVFSLPPIIPFFNKYRLINKINQFNIARYIKKEVFDRFVVKNPIIWTYMPNTVDILRYLPHKALVYDCIDKHSEFQGFINKQLVDNMEAKLAAKSNVVFTTAKGLYDEMKNFNKKVHLIPNGVDFEHFNKASTKLELPKVLKDVKKPILGFVGVIQNWIDIELIEYIAKLKPEWSIVLLGPVGAGINVDNLKKYPNIYMIGRVDYKELPKYISHFDVCLNIFKTNKLSQNVSPLKFYEYLATTKPIVSTSMQQVNQFSDCVYIAQGYDDFVNKCEQALNESDINLINRRLELSKDASWQNKVSQMLEILKEEGLINE